MSSRRRFFARLLLAFAGCWALALPLAAQEPSVTTAVVPARTVVGQPVQLQIHINGASRPGRAPEIYADGLDIQYLGPKSRSEVRMENGRFTSSTVVVQLYRVVPQRSGTFTIPSVEIDVGGRLLTTQPVALTAESGNASGGGPSIDRTGHAEIVVPKKTAYVGEAIPVELRLLVDAQIRWEPDAPLSFDCEGFTKAKLTEPRNDTTVRNGRTYDVLLIRTVLTPSKAGKLTIGPLSIPYRAQIPRAQRNRPSQLGGSLFDQLFNDPFNGFGRLEQLRATSEPVEIDVQPLPTAGRPPSFAGAVGQFTLAADGSPKQVKIGDPLTMRVRVSGTGNFDRITAPPIAEAAGWRSYPPNATFKAEDDVGLRGSKTFEMAVIPEAKKDAMPVYELAYFDPTAARYVVLKSDRVPLTVEGDAIAPGKSTPREAIVVETPSTVPAPAPPPSDILGLRYDYGSPGLAAWLGGNSRAFLLAQLVPLGGLLGMLALRFWPSASARQITALRRERAGGLGQLSRATSRDAFYAQAARLLQVDAALRTGRPPETIDATVLLQSSALEAKTRPVVEEIFAQHSAARYSGLAQNGAPAPIPAEERERIVSALSPLLRRS